MDPQKTLIERLQESIQSEAMWILDGRDDSHRMIGNKDAAPGIVVLIKMLSREPPAVFEEALKNAKSMVPGQWLIVIDIGANVEEDTENGWARPYGNIFREIGFYLASCHEDPEFPGLLCWSLQKHS